MAQKLWEKSVEVNKDIERFTVGRDREMDLYLAKHDVLGSMAHITMLESICLLTKDELSLLLAELKDIYVSAEKGEVVIEEGVEDVHEDEVREGDEHLVPAGFLDGVGVAVERNKSAARKARGDGSAVSAAARRAVKIDAVRFDCKSFNCLLQQNGCMCKFHRFFLSSLQSEVVHALCDILHGFLRLFFQGIPALLAPDFNMSCSAHQHNVFGQLCKFS